MNQCVFKIDLNSVFNVENRLHLMADPESFQLCDEQTNT